MSDSSTIDDYAIGILLRHLKGVSQLQVNAPRFVIGRDLEFLQCHWAIGDTVQKLARYVLENRHETQSLLAFRTRVDDAVARGRIDARATSLHRMRSGLATAIVSAEPVRSYATGPNHVLGWVLQQAWQMASRFLSWQMPDTGYEAKARNAVHLLDQVRRIEAIRAVLGETAQAQRPLGASMIAAERSRKKLYRLAHEAYQLFMDIERGEQEAIARMLRGTILAPLEDWRRLELAVAMAIGEAISVICQKPLHLEILGGGGNLPVVRCGNYSVHWQSLTKYYQSPPLEPSEKQVVRILEAYGLRSSTDRPDIVIVDDERACVASVIEVKFHAGDNPASRFREAVSQLVRYSRGYDSGSERCLEKSAVVMNTPVPQRTLSGENIPSAFSFEDVMQGALQQWARINLPS